MKTYREWCEDEATWWDRLLCWAVGCTEVSFGGEPFCCRCGKRVRR